MEKTKNVFDLDFDHAHELWFSLKRNGWTNCDLEAASQGDFLGEVLKHMKKCYVNFNKEPIVPQGEQIIHNNGGGLWKFNPQEIYISNKKNIPEQILYENGFNANLLDHLLEWLDQIPEEWKDLGKIYFPGTVCSTMNNFEQIRFLCWNTKWGTKREPEWWSGSTVIPDILKSKDRYVFALRNNL